MYMKKLLAVVFLVLCSTSHAAWNFTTVYSKGAPAGYIYYTSAVGTVQKEKIQTRLQFICSPGTNDAVISVYWGKTAEYNEIQLNIQIDKLTPGVASWIVDNELMYSPVGVSLKTISEIKSGRTIKINSQSAGTKFSTAFNISGVDFTEFNAKCGTSL